MEFKDSFRLTAHENIDPTLIDRLPKQLYHYTSIQSLAYILDSKTLRFSRVDQCNDPLEAQQVDLPDAKTCVFVSCWTAEEKESIPLWGLYTPGLSGVRLKLPTNMFSGRSAATPYKGGETAIVLADQYVRIERLNGTSSLQTRRIYGPNRVEYGDDAALQEVKCLHEEVDGGIRVRLHELGMTKTSAWEYEKEWRFRIFAITDETVFYPNSGPNRMTDLRANPVASTALFVPLDQSALDEMEVTLGPKATKADELIVSSLLAKYAPKATVKKSSLHYR